MEVGSPQWVAVVARLFGVTERDVSVTAETLFVGQFHFQIEHGVVLLDTQVVSKRTHPGTSEDIRRSFTEEWQTYGDILPEHDDEFDAYFDLVNLRSLSNSVAVDLGCGSGRWSAKIASYCRAVVLVDFSDAIFVAKENLIGVQNALFFRGDVTNLPFQDSSVDFLFSLGVLHHLNEPCLPVAHRLMRLAPRGLFYLYYALDGRPWFYSPLLRIVTIARIALSRVKSEGARRKISLGIAWGLYRPMVWVGSCLEKLGSPVSVPLYEAYLGKSIERIEQDAYDRFFTSIEQRVSRKEIEQAFPHDWRVKFSESQPFWHFLVERSE